jgi:DNA modification methylase
MTEPTWTSDCGSVVLYNADCLGVLPNVKADAVVTDPPYGIKKAAWDSEYPDWLVDAAFAAAPTVCIMPGLWALPKCVAQMGARYKSVLAGWNANGMTFGPVGFNNWIPAVVGGAVPRRGQDACRFTISPRDKVDHPSPKPPAFMRWLVQRVADEGAMVADPFMGSGTTGVACVNTGRRFIGIELDENYFAIAKARIAKALAERKELLVA